MCRLETRALGDLTTTIAGGLVVSKDVIPDDTATNSFKSLTQHK